MLHWSRINKFQTDSILKSETCLHLYFLYLCWSGYPRSESVLHRWWSEVTVTYDLEEMIGLPEDYDSDNVSTDSKNHSDYGSD